MFRKGSNLKLPGTWTVLPQRRVALSSPAERQRVGNVPRPGMCATEVLPL